MGRKALTHDLFIERIKEYGHNIVPLTQYVNKRTNVTMKCNICGHEWTCKPEHILQGSGCPKCAKRISGEKHRLSHSEFIKNIPNFIEVLGTYEKYGIPIKCRCKKCGYEWENNPEYLLKNKYCPKCAGIIRYTNESFRELVRQTCKNIEVLGNYEDVSSSGNIECKCTTCGHIWKPNVVSLKKGQKCPKCSALDRHNELSKTTEQFILDAKKIHGNKYDYSKVEYYNNKTSVLIICPIHGEFSLTPASHLSESGCPECAKEQRGLQRRRTNEEFIQISNLVHDNKYTYNKCIYTTKRNSVIITCPKHGDFSLIAGNHISGTGCPECKTSKGELLVAQVLKKYNIPYKYQITLKHQINNRKVIVDFVCIFNKVTYIIEYNGIQHYKPIEFFGGEKAFELQQIRDMGLRELCKNFKINLIEIPYTMSKEEVENYINDVIVNNSVLSGTIENV